MPGGRGRGEPAQQGRLQAQVSDDFPVAPVGHPARSLEIDGGHSGRDRLPLAHQGIPHIVSAPGHPTIVPYAGRPAVYDVRVPLRCHRGRRGGVAMGPASWPFVSRQAGWRGADAYPPKPKSARPATPSGKPAASATSCSSSPAVHRGPEGCTTATRTRPGTVMSETLPSSGHVSAQPLPRPSRHQAARPDSAEELLPLAT